MSHDIGANLPVNAEKLTYNTIQGHYHGVFGIAYHSDKKTLNWSMGTGCLINQKLPAFRYGRGRQRKRPVLGCGGLLGSRGNTLIISDLHIPYHHHQAFDFLFELNHIYKFDRVLCVGDLYDHHQSSFHTSEPDALSAEDEYQEAIKHASVLQGIFPKMDITPGNHCSIPQRKAKEAGLPLSMLNDFNALYNTKATWNWHDGEYCFDTRDAKPVLFPMRLDERGDWDGDIMVPVI